MTSREAASKHVERGDLDNDMFIVHDVCLHCVIERIHMNLSYGDDVSFLYVYVYVYTVKVNACRLHVSLLSKNKKRRTQEHFQFAIA